MSHRTTRGTATFSTADRETFASTRRDGANVSTANRATLTSPRNFGPTRLRATNFSTATFASARLATKNASARFDFSTSSRATKFGATP